MFSMSGVLIGDDLRFIKQYTTGNNTWQWKYIGKRVAPKGNVYQFTGTWGYPQKNRAEGEFVFSAVDQSGVVKPHEPIEGQWTGKYVYIGEPYAQGFPMNLAISLDPDAPFSVNGPFSIVGNGSDDRDSGQFQIKGTVQKVNPDGSGGQIDFVKSYSNWKWEYQGRYNGKGLIEGTWGGVAGSGSFQLEQTPHLTVAHAAPIVTQAGAVRNLSCSPALASAAVQTISTRGNNSGITAALVLSLLRSFTS